MLLTLAVVYVVDKALRLRSETGTVTVPVLQSVLLAMLLSAGDALIIFAQT